MKNKWLDEENKVYIIYQITEIQSDLGFSKKKAMDYLTELEKIGLIEKKKRGFGLPNIIYVKSFMAHQRSNEMRTSQEKDLVHRSIEIGTSEVRNKHLRGAEIDTSEVPNSGLQEVPKTVPLYNKTYISFKELDQFINLEKVLPEKESEIPQKEEYKPLTKVEELEEQNYNMVDNVLNNGFGGKERREEIRKAAESYQQKTGATITFFAAVCEEFPSMGNYFDGLTVEQVTGRYKQILADPRLSYMGNGMGFELHDSSLPDYLDGPMTLIKGHTIYADNIDSISYFREHPLVLEAIQELRERFPDFKYFMTAQEKQDIYPEHMTAEAIAYALVDLAEDFDTYEFRDNVDDKETLVKEIEYDLYAGRGKKEYAGFLKDVMDESDELNTKAQVLLQRINDYSIPEKKDLEPMVKIVFSEYREMETGKYLPFKEANEKLGALDQTFLKENQASDKWDDLYSVGYMVLCSIDSEIHKVTGKIMLGTGEGDIIEHMKGIEDQRDVQEHILPYLYEYCGLVEKSPDIATEVNEKESAANHKEVQSEAITVKNADKSTGEKKKSIHDRLKENKEKLGQKSGKDNPQKGVELT